MGRGLEEYRERIAYLDTHISIHIAEGKVRTLSPSARQRLQKSELLVSPMVVLEMEYLHEIGRSKLTSDEIMLKLSAEVGACVCALPFADIARAALREKWTRDPFDRLIVANAKANGLAWLITEDVRILEHYKRALA